MNNEKSLLRKTFVDSNSREYLRFEILGSFVTLISVTFIVLETVPTLTGLHSLYRPIEYTCAVFFAVEYACRISTADHKFKYVLSVWGLIDLVAIVPTFFQFGNLTYLKSSRSARLLRFLRMLRLLKIARVAGKSNDPTEYSLAIFGLAIFISTLLFGSVFYMMLGKDVEAYSTIPLAMLQAAKLLVGGIGYAPSKSTAAEVIVVLVRFLGLALFALLIGIVTNVLRKALLGSDSP